MKRKFTHSTLFVPTLVDAEGTRHIIPKKDAPAYCGAEGLQEFPREHRANALCQRCVQRYMRAVLNIRLEEFGL